jgi:hypothetical protein
MRFIEGKFYSLRVHDREEEFSNFDFTITGDKDDSGYGVWYSFEKGDNLASCFDIPKNIIYIQQCYKLLKKLHKVLDL